MTLVQDSSRSGVYESEDYEALRAAVVEIAEVAAEIKEVSARLKATLGDRALLASIPGAPRTGLPAERALLHAATDRDGLAYALRGGLMGDMGERVAAAGGRHSLDCLVAVASLKLRITAVTGTHPEIFEDATIAALVEAISTDRSLEAVRALRRLVRERGLGTTLHTIAPVFCELVAINALLDDNPFNDPAGWAIACGRGIEQVPLLGVGIGAICRWDAGDGGAVPVDLSPGERAQIGQAGTVLGGLRIIAMLENNGRVHVQQVTGPDGHSRFLLHAPGMRAGMPRNDTPQDLVGAWRNTLMAESPYTRALVKAIEAFGVPDGAEIALFGHSEGGAAVMNLAQDPLFHTRFQVTDVITAGAPIDMKDPPAEIFVASITNQHDLIPCLDGQGPGSPFHPQLHPHWYVVDYSDDTHRFPDCHHSLKYLENLERDLVEARARIDARLLPYQGRVEREQTYQLFDDAHAPEGFPFDTVPTATALTSAGPVELPVRCSDTLAVSLLFRADAEAAREELSASGLRPVMLGGRAVAIMGVRKFTRSSAGAHEELALGLLVHDPWRVRPIRAWFEQCKRADRRRSGIRVTDLVQSSPPAVAYGQEIWGYPATYAPIDFVWRRGVLRASVGLGDNAILRLRGSLGPVLPGPQLDLVTYSTLDGENLRAAICSDGRQRLHPFPRVRLEVASPADPLTERMLRFGLDGARPFLAFSTRHYRARLAAGVRIPLDSRGL